MTIEAQKAAKGEIVHPEIGLAMLFGAGAAAFGTAAIGVTLGATIGVALASALQKLR